MTHLFQKFPVPARVTHVNRVYVQSHLMVSLVLVGMDIQDRIVTKVSNK